MNTRRGRLARTALAALALSTWAAHGCGARSELEVLGDVPPSAAFCADAEYHGGLRELSLYVLLDKSSSMQDDNKWSACTAAVGAFAEDASVAGTEVGLQVYPRGGSCDPERYIVPLVRLAPVPENAQAIKDALAREEPNGVTPTAPALHGVITHARSLLLGDPSRAIAIALVSDGSSNICDSSTSAVSAIAAHGATQEPQVLTFVISLTVGDLVELTEVANAGGTGAPIFIGSDGTAQQLVDAFKSLRDSFKECSYAVPKVLEGDPRGSDITVSTRSGPDDDWRSLPRVGGPEPCSGEGFHVDDEEAPTRAILCAASCAAVQASDEARVRVVVGCGAGSGDATSGGGGECNGVLSFSCVPACGQPSTSEPVCSGGLWRCPEGTIPSDTCGLCPPVPHGCCVGGLEREASCIDGAWVCPAGGVLFGQQGCIPPAACAATMPCASGMVCTHDDGLCGDERVGSCQPKPASCPAASPACGCDTKVYPSVCAAQQAGVDVSVSACVAPEGTHLCGPLFCTSASQICRKTVDLTDPGPDTYDCLPAPSGCTSAGCNCGLCAPCPSGKNCNEACTGDLTEREVTCFIAP